MSSLRIGHGYDVHAFDEGYFVVLAGVKIPHTQGLRAHSDGDVAIHALCDALLGAAALGDIGQHFPDTDENFAGIDSRVLLRRVGGLLSNEGYTCVNIDLTIIAQVPKLSPHIAQMCDLLSADLSIGRDRVNVKATTTEGLGFAGREEGIAVHAVTLLEKHATF